MRIPSLSPPARALVPIVALVVLLGVLLAGSAGRRPVIDAADPRIGRGGDPLIVTGRNFGAERNGGYVEIAGVTPRSNAYLEWSDEPHQRARAAGGQVGIRARRCGRQPQQRCSVRQS